MPIKEQLHIDCEPASAFDLMADVRRLTDWNNDASRAEMTTPGPVGPGSKFIAVNRRQEMESTITTFDRPERLDFAVRSKALDVAATFRFTGRDSGTELTIEFHPTPKGAMRLIFPVLKPVIRRNLAKQHANFKAFCEAQNTRHGA